MATQVNLEGLVNRIQVGLAEEIQASTSRTLGLAGKHYRQIFETYADVVSNGPALARINQRLANIMREAVVSAYRQNVLNSAVPTYREGDPSRNAGQLLDVLESPSMAVGSAEGIGFIDVGLLNQRANHWARLNFGAAPAVGSLPAPVGRIRFGSGQGFGLRLTDGPRPGFSVPESPSKVGYFLPTGQFFPGKFGGDRSEVAVVHSRPSRRGIGARRFLDAGLVALGQNFSQAYREHFEDASRKALSRTNNARLKSR